MLVTFARYFLLTLLASLLGFGIVSYIAHGSLIPQRETNLTIKVEIRGTQGQPVGNAQVSLLTPERHFLGFTNSEGLLNTHLRVPRGKVITLQAEGAAYLATSNIVVPMVREHETFVLINPTEAAAGRVHLENRTREQMEQNRKRLAEMTPTPVPTAKPRWIVQLEPIENGLKTANNMEQILGELRKATLAKEETLKKQLVTKITLRPLWNEHHFIELLAYDDAQTLKGAFLFRAEAADIELMSGILDSMWLRPTLTEPSKARVRVVTTNPAATRAYLNGRPLPVNAGKRLARFDVNETLQDLNAAAGEIVSLAITSDDLPLVRKPVRTGRLQSKGVIWYLPTSALASGTTRLQ